MHKEEPNVHMPGVAGARVSPIDFHTNRTLIVLEQQLLLDIISLAFQEVQQPNVIWQVLTNSYQFSLCGAFRVQLLLGRLGV